MKALTSSGFRGGLLAALLASSLVMAQDKATQKDPATKEAAPAAKPAPARLPDYFPKLSLADDQKKKILGIRASYAAKINDLEAQLKALKAKEMTEVEAVLTPDQAKLLASIRTETKKKMDDAKAAKAAAEKKPAAAGAVPGAATEPTKKPEGDKKPTEKKT